MRTVVIVFLDPVSDALPLLVPKFGTSVLFIAMILFNIATLIMLQTAPSNLGVVRISNSTEQRAGALHG
jgi:hypothetical protein